MAFLKPDKIIKVSIGNGTITINQKITPDGAKSGKYICSYIPKGGLVKPNAKLNNGSGKPKGITIHNTADIKCASGTTPAEQYARATYPNGNMNGAAVHYWVWHNDIWQQLSDDEQGWHAADGAGRRKDHRGNLTGGNVDTIAIECIGSDTESEDTLVKLTAYLCVKHGLNPRYDVYTHNYWMYGKDSIVYGASKNCPSYILPHWDEFLYRVDSFVKCSQKENLDDCDDWAVEAVKWAVQNKIMLGDETGNFKLHDNCTRQEMLVFLYRLFNLMKRED